MVRRRGPLRFPSALRSTRLTGHLGIALAVTFGICFLTGLLSHLIQHPPGWFWWPSRPAGLYRVTQGLHVATGLATVPLLGVKLWSVYPTLFEWPPARTIARAAERAGVAVLVAAGLFQVVSGVLNLARWYAPMPFFFTTGHYWVAWLAVGALLVHVGVKLPVLRKPPPDPERSGGLTRRGLLAGTAAAAGVVTLATVGQTVAPLSRLSVLAPRDPGRDPGRGPQGLPVNRTAAAAGVATLARDPAYRLVVAGPRTERTLSLGDLEGMPQHTVDLPIACVEGWSATASWTGVRVRDLVAAVGVGRAEVTVESLQPQGRYRVSTLPPGFVADPRTLLALRLNGGILHPDHGYPVRLIAPNRPGVLQTKWVGRLTVRELR
jgi:DMSO/TMAO reductase YedYZ molybdopterin-dependent catalytic subunit